MHARRNIEEKADGSVTFLRLVEGREASARKDRHPKEHIVYISETLEVTDFPL